jgi:transglutaminase-like putative cysteine protease
LGGTIHVDGLGWVGFDAANRCCPNENYIRLGSGLDATDAAPCAGLVLGDVQENLDVTVVIEAQQQ